MRHRLAKLALAAAALVALAVTAWAHWTTSGSGTASASVGTLTPASISVGAGTTAGSVKVTFSQPALLNGASSSAIDYTVYRSANGGTFAPVPSGSGCYAVAYGAASCTDSGLTGSFRYYVLAHYGSTSISGWTAQSSTAGPISVSADSAAPVTTATTSPTANSAGWNNTAPVTVTLSADDNGGSGVKETRYTTDGSTPTASSPLYTAPFNVSATTTVKYFATDNAGNAETVKTLAVKIDTAPPTGGALTANGSTSSSYSTTGVISLTKVGFTDVSSGLAAGSNGVTRATATLSANGCGTFSGAAAVTIDGAGNDSSTLATGCYRYTLSAADVAGNTATPADSAVVKVDRSAPSTPSLTFSGLSANAFYDSASSRLFIRPAAGGTFTLTASSTDADTGVASYAFSNPGSSFGATQSGDHVAYTFGASTTAPSAAQTVSAANAAGGTSSNATYSIVADTTPPSGGTITANGSTGDSFNNTGSVALTKTDFTDSASGLASGSNGISRQSTTLSNGTCGTTWSAATPVAVTNGKDAATLTNGCYRYLLDATDNVGNGATSAMSALVKVDTTAPTGTLTSPAAGATGGTVTVASTTAADAGGSGVASVTFQEAPNGSTTYVDIATDLSSPYSTSWDTTTVANGAYNVRALITDAAGNSTTTASVAVTVNNSFTVSVSGGSRTAGGVFTATVTAIAGTTTNSAYTGAHTVTFSDPSNAPDGTAPSYPATALTFTTGVASASITLYKAETTTLTATSGFLTGTSSSFAVTDGGAPGGLAFSNTSPLACATVFSCSVTVAKGASYASALSLTDQWGNLGPKMTGNSTTNVTVSHTNSVNTLTGTSLQITKNTGTPSGTQTGGTFTFTASTTNGSNNDTVTASASGLRPAVVSITVH